MPAARARSIEEAEVHIQSLTVRLGELERLLRLHDDEIEMVFRTPYWKRLLFRLDGWPLHRVIRPDQLPSRPWRKYGRGYL